MAGDGADGNRGTSLRANAQVQLRDVTERPASLCMMGLDRIGGFDKGPFQILVTLHAHPSVAGLPPAGAHAWGGATRQTCLVLPLAFRAETILCYSSADP
jgi:hypothetical protein